MALVAVFSLTILGVFVSIWAGNRADEIRGPTEFARDGAGNLWISVNRDLYEIDAAGQILRIIESEGSEALKKGIQALIVDSSGDLRVAYGQAEEIHRILAATGELVERLAVGSKAPTEFPGNVYKFAIDPKNGDLYLADTRNHHIRIFGANGEFKRTFGGQGEAPEQFHFPNDIRFGPDGLLYICDTNNHRIGAFDRAGAHRFSIETASSESSVGMVWPTQFEFAPDGTILAINKGPGLIGGEIVRLDRKAGFIERITLPANADPIDLLLVGEEIWVTDEAHCEVLRYTLGGKRLENFEAGEFEELLSWLHFERTRYQLMMGKAQAGLFGLLLLLIIIYLIERKQKAKEAALADPLAGRWDIRELPIKIFSLKKKLKSVVLLLLVWIGGSVVASIVVVGLFGSGTNQGPLEVSSLTFKLVIWLLILTIAVAVLLVTAGAIRDGALHQMQIKTVGKIFDKQKRNLGNSLAPDEAIRVGTTARLLGRGFLTTILAGPWFSDVNLFIVTTKRVLILTTDMFATGLRRIQEISFARVEEMDLSPKRNLHRWMSKLFGSGFLTIKLAGETRALGFQFIDGEVAEAVRAEILDRAVQMKDEDFPSPGRICLKCFQSAPGPFTACPACGHGERPAWIPTLFSLLYPGVGQFLNHNLIKGVILFTIASFIIFAEAATIFIAVTGSAEIVPESVNSFVVTHIILSAIASVDAYFSAKR